MGACAQPDGTPSPSVCSPSARTPCADARRPISGASSIIPWSLFITRPVPGSKTASKPGANTPCPHLGIQSAGKKPVAGSQFVLVNLVFSRLDVDNHKLAFISGSNMRAYLSVVNLISAASELLFAVQRFGCVHFVSPLQLQAAKSTLLTILHSTTRTHPHDKIPNRFRYPSTFAPNPSAMACCACQAVNFRNSAGVTISMPRNGFRTSKSVSPVTM